MGQALIVPALIGCAIGMACDAANSVLNGRPYNPRVVLSITDTPSTRRASGNIQNDNLQRLFIKDTPVRGSTPILQQSQIPKLPPIQTKEQKEAEQRQTAFKGLISGLEQKPNAYRIPSYKLPPKPPNASISSNAHNFAQIDKILETEHDSQQSKLLCSKKLQHIAIDFASELVAEVLSHGSAITVPNQKSEQYKKFKELLNKKRSL